MRKYLDHNLEISIREKLRKLNQARPLSQAVIAKLQKQFQIEMTYNSNAIEGNSLTLKETFLVINEGITIKNKPLKDHLEAKNHQEALDYLYDLIDKNKRQTMSEQLIRSIHQLIIQETDKKWAGKYRDGAVYIGGADHIPPDALEVPHAIKDLFKWLKQNTKKLHIIELASLFHHKLVNIHPFFDGNGRTARLIMNLLLMQKGYPLVIILKSDRRRYYKVLQQADKGDVTPLIRFIAQSVNRSLNIYLKVLLPTTKKTEEYLSLSKISKQTPYSAKYLNLLIRQGKLEAYKERRDWVTTEEAVDEYIKNRARKRKL